MTHLLDYIELTARRFPDKTAFSDVNESVTFARLRELGQRVGTYIAARAKKTGLPVAVLTTHSVADVAAFMGALYAGCFYVPLDGSAPETHTNARLDAIDPVLVIDAKTLAELPVADSSVIDHAALDAIRRKILSADPAYAIFTSGSTGTPKAAVVSHGSVINLTEWMCTEFNFTERTVFAGQAPFYFDSSVQELYSTLKCGGRTHLFPKHYFISPLKVLELVDEIGANVMPWAAAAVKLIANSKAFEKYVPGGVTDVIFGGENMPAKILNIWRRAMPDARFTNVYGPAETTVDCSYYTVTRDLADEESVPIGYPVRDTELLLLDEDKNPVPNNGLNEPGELYVRGAGVGLGYYNNPGRTADSFIQNPNSLCRDIIYRTGDIAKVNEHGELVFLARADNQVKHMGSRVELGEVEAAAAAIDGVRLVCCSYDKENAKILMFYEGTVDEKALTAGLSTRLPRYMCPNVVIKVDEMPAIPSGKIDRLKVRKVYYDDKQL